jgi:hypothetical protein
MESYSLKKIYFLIIISFIFLIIGILLIVNFQKNNKSETTKINLSKKNIENDECILHIYNVRNKESIYFTYNRNFVKKDQCNNDVSQLPILNYQSDNKLINQKEEWFYFLNSYWKIVSINPSIIEFLSEIKINQKEVLFFLNNRKIRIDIKDYTKKNWEEKFISLVILINKKNINKAYLDIREEDSLLIFDGEI